MDTTTKVCTLCGAAKTLEEYNLNHLGPYGRASRCRPCEWAYQLAKRYGLSAQEYRERLEAQHGVCAICQTAPSPDARRQNLSVDHDHVTGDIRGLLCAKCNAALGLFDDDPAVLLRATQYMTR